MTTIDQHERDRARTATVNVLVEAGAGTGKTTLLIERVIDGILNRRIPLSRVLLITFMDKAQEEMRQRLQARLLDLESTDESGLIEEALKALPHAAITTIHGFCNRVLNEFGADYGIPVGFRVLDDVETDRLWKESFLEWIQHPEHSDTILRLLHAGINWGQLSAWARQICDWPEVPEALGAFPNLGRFIDQYAEAAEEYLAQALAGAGPGDKGLEQIQAISREFRWLRQVEQTEWPRMLAQWTAGLAPKGNKKNWRHPELLASQKEWIGELREELAALRQQMADAYLADWLRLIGQGFRPYWRRVRFQALALTYDDLLIEADRITREARVWSMLHARYDLVMVDEFQDTDTVQSAIIRRLVTPVGSSRLSPEDQGRLFLVGDPKQSIYRFRGADVETYAAVRQELSESGGQVVPIFQNFRSHPAILEYVNQVFSERWPATPDATRPFIPPFFPLESEFPKDGLRRLAVERLGEGGSARTIRRQEAAAIADLIERAIGEAWLVRGPAGPRPITYGDIALVVPQRTGLDIYRQALRDRQIPVASQSGRSFFQQDEIRGLSLLFRALDDPRDGVAAVGWLTSPWVALSHEDLALHKRKGGTWNYLESQLGHAAVLDWWEKLRTWHSKFWRVDPETIMDWALETSALPVVLAERNDMAALANLNQMRALCRQFGDRWGIMDFTAWFTAQVREQVPFEEADIVQAESQVVFSTVHQAKGLEWPMVIVANWKPKETYLEPGIHYNPRLKAVALRQEPWVSRHWDDLEGDHRLREEAEGDRLLYVALTRAKDYLWFYASFLDNAPMLAPGSKSVDITLP